MTTDFLGLQRWYTYQQTFQTNISSEAVADSGSNWGVWEMLRESIQNMMDEAEYMADINGGELLDYCKVNLHDASLELKDAGRGVEWEQIFLIGLSGKRGSHYRGQKGEGEGLSFLVAARKGIQKVMYSKDWAVKARLDYYADSAYKVLVFDLYRTKNPVVGTIWRYERTTELVKLYRQLGNYFPQLSKREMQRQHSEEHRREKREAQANAKRRKEVISYVKSKSTSSNKMIITPTKGQKARLFVRGIYVKEIYSLFSYNLQNVEINRDRSMVDELGLLVEIQNAFNSSDLTLAQAALYWQNAEDGCGDLSMLEYKTIINFVTNRELMVKAFAKAFGKKACMFTDKAAALDAQGFGYKVIDLHPHVRNVARSLGVTTDVKAIGYEDDVLPWHAVTNKAKALITKLQVIGEAFGFKRYDVKPALKRLGGSDSALGWYINDEVYLLRSTLEGDRLRLLETYIHECGHGESGASDATREFTQWFETMLIEALVGKHDHLRSLIDELVKM